MNACPCARLGVSRYIYMYAFAISEMLLLLAAVSMCPTDYPCGGTRMMIRQVQRRVTVAAAKWHRCSLTARHRMSSSTAAPNVACVLAHRPGVGNAVQVSDMQYVEEETGPSASQVAGTVLLLSLIHI